MPPPPMSMERKSWVYKNVGGTALELDVIGADTTALKPCVVWIHGGGLIFGSRTISPRPGLARLLVDRGFVVVSIDHRLAPETKLPAIVDDVTDAWRWVVASGPRLFGIDPGRLCLAGASAGAFLSLLAGSRVLPRPCALASFWGFGDITAPWEALASEHYRGVTALVSESDARAALALTPVPTADGNDRSTFYLYCRQQGRWLPEVTGHDMPQDAAWLRSHCPLFSVDATCPPTVLVHGRDDTDVPASESDRLAHRLSELGVVHAYHALPGVGHGFAGATPEQVLATETVVVDFLSAQVSR